MTPEIYTANPPISLGEVNNKPNYVVGLLIKPEAYRYLSWKAQGDENQIAQLANKLLQQF